MAKIQVLPDVLASQVAAGEVVERPASVIKELVENSLDAGARQIEVRIDRGGTALMRVSDDGCGMAREDAVLSLERHATSKLRDVADLGAIRTLGFRGEALPSIASVSRFSLATREAGALAGTEVLVEGGTLREVRDWGGAPGTVIEVRDLFFNVPARRKFLRSENTEFGHIEQTVRVQALAHPEVGFTLLRDSRILFQLPSRAPLQTRIAGLIGADQAGVLIERTPIDRGGLCVHGWLSSPGRGRADRSLSLVFVNGRPVENPALSFALRAAYGDTLARGQHPLCFLFVEMDPQAVDVNVHPSKREVRFRDGLGVQATLASVLQECLRPAAASVVSAPTIRTDSTEWVSRSQRKPRDGWHSFPGESPPPPAAVRVTPVPVQPTFPLPSAPGSPLSAPTMASPPVPPPATGRAGTRDASQPTAPGEPADMSLPAAAGQPTAVSVVAAGRGESPRQSTYRLLGLLAQTYALFESDEGLVLMDLRAAHERVLYENLRAQSLAAPTSSQPLLVPLVLTLPPRESALVRDHLALLQRLGFGLEEFGSNTLKVESLPAHLPPTADPAAWLADLLHDLTRLGEGAARARLDFDSLAAAVAARATPRSAARTETEIDSLLTRLLACDMPYCDPLGRPTLIQFSHQELARKFGRRPT
ncbi:MAG: DNA mismatch repair endonuclease MutL [Verrucomicrobiales bacterium]